MITLTFGEVATAVSGRFDPAGTDATDLTTISGNVETDSREIVDGGIFVAKPGDVTDGHRFVDAAVHNGAALAIVEHNVDVEVPQIVVHDAVEALAALAAEVVGRVKAMGNLTVVGITGSNGKTTTKNLLGAILSPDAETVMPRKSFNNTVGAPTTMLRVTESTRYLISEMGASGPGHIAHLAALAKPDIGIELKVGMAHAGGFGGIEQTAAAKTELVAALPSDGVAILNRDDPRVVAMATKTSAHVVWFGEHKDADVRADDIVVTASGTTFTVSTPDGDSIPVAFKVLGEHHVWNALAALACAREVGIPLATAVRRLESVTRAERWRMEVMGGRDGITIINDAYNASPDSMAAALKTLALVTPSEHRTVAVLGAMSELGEFAGDEHDRIGLMAVRLGIDQLVVVGPEARRLHISAINEGSWAGESAFMPTAEEAYEYLAAELRAGDTVLVKSSNSVGLRFLGDRLGELFS
ncbi:UDP-N-acetylmuramoyl-tripeptide--D-alanyl-D-alanine ligase [Microbacterium sp. MPKO10]|uniref:UDP-N-acetylmuramoyl-tripeptide--D-alanyl-D- alanine ligase n=1 Tax=Microbacterium sp. MPKO10 TaxID=2989818 RepID=UPI0022368E7B|nr:UDP-N-acetylmuramoyl-tripeptide--D-alanyl-D-alanine ligase [Microbacterium sp. MPKO10]MCW4459401.1 UDP-N-acetylmuramoyl-tripeptide--D-alanyl-D-alanine ligase [Microbacterium sp. MPKO10]